MGHRYETRTCMFCLESFEARLWDIDHKVGGFFCSLSCRASYHNRQRTTAQAAPKPHHSESKPTQKQIVLDLLKRHGKVTMSQFFQEGVGYTFRNRVSELRRDGYKIDCQLGKRPSENVYVLLATPEPMQAGVQ